MQWEHTLKRHLNCVHTHLCIPDNFEFPTPEEADLMIEQLQQQRAPKSKAEIRQYIDEIEYYLQEKNVASLKDFSTFKSTFIDNSNKEKNQPTILSYFNVVWTFT